MSLTTLLLSAVIAATVGGVYLYVGDTLRRRPVPSGSRMAWWSFCAWWYGIGIAMEMAALMTGVAALGYTQLELFLAHGMLERIVITASVAGLMHYFVFLFTGKQEAWRWVGLVYLGYFVFTTYTLFSTAPTSVEVNAWGRPRIIGASPRPLLSLTSALFLLLPPIIASGMYFRLRWRIPDAAQRYRVTLVALGIIIWWLPSVAAFLLHAVEWLQVFNRLIGAGAALLVYLAYHPPRGVRLRLGIHDDAPATLDAPSLER